MIKCSVGLIIDAFSNVIPDWDLNYEEVGSVYQAVWNLCKNYRDEQGWITLNKKMLNFISEEESNKILNYIKNNSDNDNPLSFEIELLFNSNGIA